MTSEELIYEFHLILNKNASYQNVDVSKGNFVWLFNREQLYWLDDFITKQNSTEKIHQIQGLTILDEKLTVVSRHSDKVLFTLPEKYFSFIDCYSHFEKDGCVVKATNYLVNPKETKLVFDNFKPSFQFEEGLCNIASEKLVVFFDDFKINDAYLSYYQRPVKIDIEGYEKIDGTMSTTIDSDLDEMLQTEIINRVVLEVMRQFENGNGYKLSTDRVKV